MTVDLATLGIKIDASEVTPAATKLDTLTAAGTRAEASTKKLKTATVELGSVQSGVSNAVKTLASDVEGAAGHVQGSSLKIRESLVLMREASRGNFTRMAGSASILAGAFGLLTPAVVGTVAAIVAGVLPFALLALAMERGSEQAAKLNNALLITGGYSGVTASSFESMARRISAANGTSLRSTQAGILQLIQSGKFSATAIGFAVDAAQRFSRFTGESTDKILQSYEGMKGGVAKWGAKHEETYHDLTLAQLLYIDQLEKQGKHEAAETELMKDIDDHVRTLHVSYGLFEGIFHKVEIAASNMWAAIMNYGKPDTPQDKINKALAAIQAAQNEGFGGRGNPAAMQAKKTADIDAAFSRLRSAMAEKKAGDDKAAADAKKAQDESNKIQLRFGPKIPKDNTLSNATGELNALKARVAAQQNLNKALADGSISVDQLNKQDKVNADLGPILKKQAEDFAKGTAQGKKDADALTPVIAKMRIAYNALYDANLETKIRKQNDAMEDQNRILQKQISLVGKTAEQRAVELAMFRKEIELGDQAKTPAGQAQIALAGKGATLGARNARAALGNANVDAGTNLATSAAQATLASDPKNYIKQQAAAYAEINKLRQADVLNEQQAIQAKAKVDASILQQRLGNASDFFSSLATLSSSKNKELAAIGKAAAISQATIDGVLAVQKALAAYPPPINFIEAGAVGIASAVNVAKIAGLANGGPVIGPGGATDDRVPLWGSNGEFMMNARATAANRPALEAMNSGRPANSNTRGIAVEFHNHGTPQNYQVQQMDEGRIRIIARDEVSQNAPKIMAQETGNANSPFRRTLSQHTNVQRKIKS